MLASEAVLGVIFSLASLALATETAKGPEKNNSQSSGAIVNGIPIDTGYVIVRGEYLSCPYTVGTRGEELFVNGRPIDSERLQVHRWGFGGPYRDWQGGPRAARSRDGSDSPGTDPRPTERPSFNGAAYAEGQLKSGSLLIVFNDGMGTFLLGGSEIAVLETLLANTPPDEKKRALTKLNTRWVESARWIELVDAFKPSEELAARIEKVKQERAAATAARPLAPSPNLSHSIKYSTTVIGIVLGVVALGTLLNHRPTSKARWSEIDVTGDSTPMVVRNVVLVAVLSFFDLGCTLLAQQSPGFVESNPLGNHLIDSPWLLAAFKIASLLMGCVILLALRRYRGAQVASWWLCLVCTILTFRWATWGSFFLS
jgi:hypothetical protein